MSALGKMRRALIRREKPTQYLAATLADARAH
jgi:hypothetical protein